MNSSVSIIILTILVLACSQQQFYKKHINTHDPEAKCLDGTPPLYYIHQGKQTKKFLIFVEGGGLCGQSTISRTLQSCYQRSKTILGSSALWPDVFPSKDMGYLETDPEKNKFSEWTKFIFGYCDGSIHQGHSKQPVEYKGTKLFFRGNAIMKSQFNHLNQQYGLFDAQAVVFTGGSAGGVANYFWANYLRQKMKNPQALVTIPDSGIFVDAKSAKTGKQQLAIKHENLYKFSNRDQHVPIPQCVKIFQNEPWKCLFFQNIFPFIKGKFLVIESQYDSWAIANDLQQSCITKGLQPGIYTLKQCSKKQLEQIQQYRKELLQALLKFLNVEDRSVWSISCSSHVYACLSDLYDSEKQKVGGKKLREAVQRFALNGQRIFQIDSMSWPLNFACAY